MCSAVWYARGGAPCATASSAWSGAGRASGARRLSNTAPPYTGVLHGGTMTVTPRTPPGVLELLPSQQIAHQRMLDTIRRGFERFGFLPVETPVFELSDVLLTKTGGETEKQVYFAQSTGALKQGGTPE